MLLHSQAYFFWGVACVSGRLDLELLLWVPFNDVEQSRFLYRWLRVWKQGAAFVAVPARAELLQQGCHRSFVAFGASVQARKPDGWGRVPLR